MIDRFTVEKKPKCKGSESACKNYHIREVERIADFMDLPENLIPDNLIKNFSHHKGLGQSKANNFGLPNICAAKWHPRPETQETIGPQPTKYSCGLAINPSLLVEDLLC